MRRILLVEDDKSLLDGLVYSLQKNGYEPVVARTVKEFGQLWGKREYDLLLLDVTLSDGTGFEICEKVRKTSAVPVIFLTASEGEYHFLSFLMENSGRVLTGTQIVETLWDCNESFVDDNTLSVYVRRLRSKVEEEPSNARHLLTVRGLGYQWKP